MDYQAFTNESLTMMYAAVRGAMVADDAIEHLGQEPRFKVRDTPEWKKHAADLEKAVMLRRGMVFEVIVGMKAWRSGCLNDALRLQGKEVARNGHLQLVQG